MNASEIIEFLKKSGTEVNRTGMSRYGINTEKAFGCPIPLLRALAKQHKKEHGLALELWSTGFHEARILAGMIDDPTQVSDVQMEQWVCDFNSWDLCDQCCMNLFEKLPRAWKVALEWSEREEEYVKRAGFVLMARLAVSDKKAADDRYFPFLESIQMHAADNRNMVKKAVNWALRQIGKRNKALHSEAVRYCELIMKQESKAAKWIALDALRELKSKTVIARIRL